MIDLGFGDSFLLRDLLFTYLNPSGYVQTFLKKENLGYGFDDIKIRNYVRDFLIDFTGTNYNSIILTHGATGGVLAAIRGLGHNVGMYDDVHYIFYPEMFKNTGVFFSKNDARFLLTSSPNNPTGEIRSGNIFNGDVIWDAAYHTPAYMSRKNLKKRPNHKVVVGSFSKLLGLNGIRLGFVATNDYLLANEINKSAETETLGLSNPSLSMLNGIVDRIDINLFSDDARRLMDDNREEMSKIEYLFNCQVPENGMFYFPKIDAQSLKILDKAKIKYIEGNLCGDPQRIRLSLGQTRDITKRAVDLILKIDQKKG